MKSSLILKRCGLLKRSGDLKSFGAGKFKGFQQTKRFAALAKHSSNESHLHATKHTCRLPTGPGYFILRFQREDPPATAGGTDLDAEVILSPQNISRV